MRLTLQEAKDRYGEIKAGVWHDAGKWLVVYKPPKEICDVVLNGMTGSPMKTIYCNKDIVPNLDQALKNIVAHNLQHELKTYDGCFNIRDVRGIPGQPSTHSYGLAIDWGAKDNPLRGETTFSSELIQCFTDAGFTWGGNFQRKDPMHFSSAWE